jgi:FAD/FMN-containing dehydrogenase
MPTHPIAWVPGTYTNVWNPRAILGKREFLEQEHGAEALTVMRAVKQAPDPRGVMNPGKIFLS